MKINTFNSTLDDIEIDFNNTFQAKQRSSIKWLLSKAYNNKTPSELVEPFYKDHDVSKLSN